MIEPTLIKGGIFNDKRGEIRFVNDFYLHKIKRFYIITQSPENGPRAWQGHKTESKYFYCLNGYLTIWLAKIDDWEDLDPNPHIESFKLSSLNSDILFVPGGYANGIVALEKDTQLLVFSEYTIAETKGDEVKIDKEKWKNWEAI